VEEQGPGVRPCLLPAHFEFIDLQFNQRHSRGVGGRSQLWSSAGVRAAPSSPTALKAAKDGCRGGLACWQRVIRVVVGRRAVCTAGPPAADGG